MHFQLGLLPKNVKSQFQGWEVWTGEWGSNKDTLITGILCVNICFITMFVINQYALHSVTTEQKFCVKHTEVIGMHSPHKYLASVTNLYSRDERKETKVTVAFKRNPNKVLMKAFKLPS